MKSHNISFFSLLTLLYSSIATSTATVDFATKCYTAPLPSLTASSTNRTIPWGKPELKLPNGTICCDSLEQVRDGIDEVDGQLVELLALRAGYVREATRFKATLNTVDDPSRDAEVIQAAVAAANMTTPPLPETVATGVFEALLNVSVGFEECVFETFGSVNGTSD